MDFLHDELATPNQRLGRTIYMEALYGRRGFRDDQLGIEVDDEVWLEIFEDIGQTAIAAVAKL